MSFEETAGWRKPWKAFQRTGWSVQRIRGFKKTVEGKRSEQGLLVGGRTRPDLSRVERS